MVSLIQSIYTSASTVDFKEHEIPMLLEAARLKNTRLAVTGVLLYIGGNFFQVLEGESVDVSTLYGSILRDSRHARVREVSRRHIVARDFADWHLGFCTLERHEAGDLLGNNDIFSDDGWVNSLNRERAQRLVEMLRDRQYSSGGYTGRFQSPRPSIRC
jgi:hypothetical protein